MVFVRLPHLSSFEGANIGLSWEWEKCIMVRICLNDCVPTLHARSSTVIEFLRAEGRQSGIPILYYYFNFCNT
jgi:hypothetical protein